VIDLSGVGDTGSVPAEIARSLGVEEAGSQPVLSRIIEHLYEKRLLLLLDNLEQISAASKEIAMILESCPHVKVLGTSRAPLCVRSEHVFSVTPLDVPNLRDDLSTGKLLASSAVRLFIERAKSVKGDFIINDQNLMAVVQICSRLDGLPLAIELAAAWSKLLSPRQILERLGDALTLLISGPRDLPERQRTLRAAIEWSYDLLGDGERRLFARLAIFAGSFALEAAERVCGAQLETLESLIEKSLVRATSEGRFFMLETIHEFAAELLEKSGEAEELARAHAEWTLDLAESAGMYYNEAEGSQEYELVVSEQANLRAASDWALRFGLQDRAYADRRSENR